jgi:hypothetical protein
MRGMDFSFQWTKRVTVLSGIMITVRRENAALAGCGQYYQQYSPCRELSSFLLKKFLGKFIKVCIM